jgi:methionine sulfoxide reductase heme-binding subunit
VDSREPLPWLKPGLFVGALAPLFMMLIQALTNTLGANPVAQVENWLGLSALVLLVASLACTPARQVFGWKWTARIRRELGLFAFFYASLHVLTYFFVDQGLDAGRIIDDITQRPFITVGAAAMLLLIPLAITSTKGSIRRLGFRRWRLLHQLVYAAAILAAIHFLWRVKIDLSQPLVYCALVGILLAIRLAYWIKDRRVRKPPPARRAERVQVR